MAKLSSVEFSLIKNKVYEEMKKLFNRIPTEQENAEVEEELERRLPQIKVCRKKLVQNAECIKQLRIARKELIETIQTILSNAGIKRGFDSCYSEPDYVSSMDNTLKFVRNDIAMQKGYLKTLNQYYVEKLISENIILTPIKGKEMCELLEEVVVKTAAAIKENPDKYFEK